MSTKGRFLLVACSRPKLAVCSHVLSKQEKAGMLKANSVNAGGCLTSFAKNPEGLCFVATAVFLKFKSQFLFSGCQI